MNQHRIDIPLAEREGPWEVVIYHQTEDGEGIERLVVVMDGPVDSVVARPALTAVGPDV